MSKVKVLAGYDKDGIQAKGTVGDGFSVTRWARNGQGWEMIKLASKTDAVKFAALVSKSTGLVNLKTEKQLKAFLKR
jgi:hypothetical protein